MLYIKFSVLDLKTRSMLIILLFNHRIAFVDARPFHIWNDLTSMRMVLC